MWSDGLMASPTNMSSTMPEWQQGRCPTADGASLRWFRSGGGGPPLLLVHGFTDNALYLGRLAEHLATDWDVVAYDARGHGASDRVTDRFDDALRVSDLKSVLEALDLERPAMFGHSMGAATIAQAVASTPGLARAVVLEDPAWWEPTAAANSAEADEQEAARRSRNNAWRDWLHTMQQSTRQAALASRRAESPLWSDDDVTRSVNARMEVQLELFDHFPSARSDWRTVVPSIDCPTLLVIGDNELGGIITPEVAAEASERNPSIVSAHISGAGHSIRYDQFDTFLAAVVPFLSANRN